MPTAHYWEEEIKDGRESLYMAEYHQNTQLHRFLTYQTTQSLIRGKKTGILMLCSVLRAQIQQPANQILLF